MAQSLLRSDSFRILFNSPELSEVQRSSFHLFLKKGIAEELSKISCIPIKNVHFVVEIIVDASNFRLVAPENSYRDCILKMKSYTCKLYVQTKILFKDKVSGELLYQTQPEWILLADLPMMTRRGHFVINGSPRIVVHQVGRAPGVYFKKVLKVKNDVTNKARFYGDIIPRKGVWVRLQINKKGEIDLKLKKSKKVRAEMVQKCLELLEKENLFSYLQKPLFVDKSQTIRNSLFTTIGLKPNFQISQNPYKTKVFSGVYKPSFTGVTKAMLCKTELCKSTAFARTHKLRKESFALLRKQSTAKKQALIRNLFYFKGIKVGITNKVASKALLFDGAEAYKNEAGLFGKAVLNSASFFAAKMPNTDKNINAHTLRSTPFFDNLNSSRRFETSGLALGESESFDDGSRLLPLNTNSYVSNKIVRSYVIQVSSGKFFSAFTRTEKEAFANVYTSFYKNEIQDIEKRVSVSNKPGRAKTEFLQTSGPLLAHAKISQNRTKVSSIKSNLLSTNESPIESKTKNISKTKLVKTRFLSSPTETQTKLCSVTSRASLRYGNKKRIVKKTTLSNNLKKIREYLYQLFKKSDSYDLGFVGRDKINSKFGISVKETQLTALDIKKTINWLSKLRAGKEEVDDIDHSQNRRVRTSSELIQTQFEIGITRLKNGILKRVLSPSGAINVKGEQIKASFYSKPCVKESKDLGGVLTLSRTFKAQNNLLQNKIKENTTSFYSQTLWHGKKQGLQKRSFCITNFAKTCFVNNYTLNLVYYAQSFLSNRIRATSLHKQSLRFKQKSLYCSLPEHKDLATLPLLNYYLAIVFVQSHFGLQIAKPLAGVQAKLNKKQLNFTFSKLHFKGGNTCFVKQDAMSVKVKPSKTKIQNFYTNKNKSFASCTNEAVMQKLRKESKAFLRKHNSVFVTTLLAKRNSISLCSQERASIVKEQKNLTFTQNISYSSNDLVSDLSASEWFSTKPINGALREFFSSSPLSQYMDQTNPLAEVTHKRRISSLGVGGVSRESAGMTIRGIHPTHYGRICPIETPEGKNAGLVNSLAFYARVNNQGFIETPYYQVIKGQVQHELGFSFYSARQESRNGLSIAPNDIKQSKSKLLASNISTVESIPVRIADNLLDLFKKKRVSQVNCIGISPVQILSVATSLIPFLEHNDANRALMGSNMQRQAVSLMISERPLVGTGLEARVLAESGHLVQSKVSGFISTVSAHQVVVERLVSRFSESFVTKQKPKRLQKQTGAYKNEFGPCKNPVFAKAGLSVIGASFSASRFLSKDSLKKRKVLYKSTFKQSFERKAMQTLLASLNAQAFAKKKVALSPVIHSITTFSRSNQETCLTQKPLVEEGDWVQKGDMLSDCSAGQKGELSVGKNMFIAYIPWQGYNFEDAIVISDRLVKEQLYSSLHIERYTVIVNDFKDKTVDTNEWFTGKLPGVDSKKRAHLQKSGLPRIGAMLREGDILVGKIKYSKKKPSTPHEKLVCDILGEHNFSVQNTSLYVPKGVHEARVLTYKIKKRFDKALKTGIATGAYKSGAHKNEAYAKASLLHNEVLHAEASTSGGAKNKVFGKAQLEQEEHNASIKTRVLDSATNLRPAGAPKVVHIFLGERRNIQVGDKMSGRHGNKGIVSTILPKQDMPYLADGSPIDILLNPLGVPSRMNVGQVFECLLGLASTYLHQNFKITAFDELYGVEASQSLVFLKLYQARLQSGQNWLFQINFPGKTRLTDGRSGECLDQWITVGKAYMLKLIHMVNEKIHARAIGPYALVTQQPLKGRAHKGGQRLGEMEVWAIEGFGAAYILQELLTKKSDDSIGRKEVLKAMLPKSASLLDFIDPFGQSANTSTHPKENNVLHSETLISSNLTGGLQNEVMQKQSFCTQAPASAQHQSFTVLGQPDIFKVLICELQALCLDVGVYSIKTESFQRQFVEIFE